MPDMEEMDDESLFNSVTEGDPDAPVTEQPETLETREPEKTEPTEGAEKLAAEPEKAAGEEKTDARIPAWRREEIAAEKNRAVDEARAAREQLATERSQREQLERRLAAIEKPVPKAEAAKPDPLLDPEGYEKYLETKFEERLLNDRREDSLANAHKTYKMEFEEAYAAAQKAVDPALKARMQQSRDPGETLIAWHRERKTQAEIGGDLNAYKAKLRDEALKDPEFRKAAMAAWREQAPTQANGRPRVDLPPSLNGASRSNSMLRSDGSTLTDTDLWNEITA